MKNPKIGDQGTVPVIEASPPVSGLLQQDFPYQDNIDGANGFPLNLDYFIPVNCQRVVTARLSFKRRAYRTYNTITGANTGNASVSHLHATGGETGHSHSHNHGLNPLQNQVGTSMVWTAGGNLGATAAISVPDSSSIQSNANGSSGHSHGNTGGQNVTHNHALNLTQTLGVTESTVATGITISFDGVDQTANLLPAGPYATDQVEMDVTKFISTVVDRQWHTVSFLPTGLGRINAVLRILYNSNQV